MWRHSLLKAFIVLLVMYGMSLACVLWRPEVQVTPSSSKPTFTPLLLEEEPDTAVPDLTAEEATQEPGDAAAPDPIVVITGDGSLRLERSVYRPGERMELYFEVPGTLPQDAWVGIVPSDVPHGRESENDTHNLGWEYLGERTSGEFTFQAPGQIGSYDFRLNDTESDGRELSFITFQVVPHDNSRAEIRLQKSIFSPGEEIKITFTAPETLPSDAWIGILPFDTPHGSESAADQSDVAWDYLNGEISGSLVLWAPETPGTYEVRMFDTDNDGNELFAAPFQVQ